MINIFSINCDLALAPYLVESLGSFIERGVAASRVVRQGGSGLIIRSDGRLFLRYQNREAVLGADEARHYLATVEFRESFYDVKRLSDEVIFTSLGRSLLLSHPQSTVWLDTRTLAALLAEVEGSSETDALPEWLHASSGDGKLLISDQRNGRWVLLGSDHLSELGRRLKTLRESSEPRSALAPPTIPIKGLAVHLQSAFRLARAMETFAESGQVEGYEEAAPTYYLRVARSVEGMELIDSNVRVAVTAREARKWAGIIRSELSRLGAEEIERGEIRTVFAAVEGGWWALQAGDELFVPEEMCARLAASSEGMAGRREGWPAIGQRGGLTLLLEERSGGCVALTREELKMLARP